MGEVAEDQRDKEWEIGVQRDAHAASKCLPDCWFCWWENLLGEYIDED